MLCFCGCPQLKASFARLCSPKFNLCWFLCAGSRDDLAVSLGDTKHEVFDNAKGGYSSYSEGLSDEKQMNSWSHAKVETMHDYETSDHKFNAEGKF